MLTGTYQPPFGFIGLIGDRVFEGRVAMSTAEAFLEPVARHHGLGPRTSTSGLTRKPSIAGSMLGSGSVVVMDETSCVVWAAWRISRFFSRESCGQCTPCREPSGWEKKILQRIEEGDGHATDLDLRIDACDNIVPGLTRPRQQTTICPLGPPNPPYRTSMDWAARVAVELRSPACSGRSSRSPKRRSVNRVEERHGDCR